MNTIKRLKSLHNVLKEEGEQKCSPEINTVAFVLMDAATSLSTLQAENERLRAELEQVQRDFDGLCEYIDSEGFLRKQFCESGNLDLEPCICPSLQEHPGYIDSDDCEGVITSAIHGVARRRTNMKRLTDEELEKIRREQK